MTVTPSVGLDFIVRTGLAEVFFPELPKLQLEQDPIHRHKDVLAHTLAVVDKTSPDRLLRLAAVPAVVALVGTAAAGRTSTVTVKSVPRSVKWRAQIRTSERFCRSAVSTRSYSLRMRAAMARSPA